MKNLAGKIAIVTGASKGIGEAIARRFAAEEVAGMALLARGLGAIEALAKELDPTGDRIIAIQCDVSKSDDCKAAVEATLAKFGRVDILVNNAGITRDRMFHKMSDDDWYAVLNTNLGGMYNMTKHVINAMREQNGGAIVNITSTSMMGNAGQTNYSTSKAAMQGFTRALAKEGARKNVRINCVAPGYIDTEMMWAVGEEKVKAGIARHPSQRLASPDEIAAVVEFFCTDDSSWVTGQNIFACGGSTCN